MAESAGNVLVRAGERIVGIRLVIESRGLPSGRCVATLTVAGIPLPYKLPPVDVVVASGAALGGGIELDVDLLDFQSCGLVAIPARHRSMRPFERKL